MAIILKKPTEFERLKTIRKRKQKQQFDYEHEDKTPQNPEDLFKINFCNLVLDTTINSLEERSEELTVHNNYFNFLCNLENLNNKELKKKHCNDLEF